MSMSPAAVARALAVAAVALAALGSASSSPESREPAPTPAPAAQATAYCMSLQTAQSTTSMCFNDLASCQGELDSAHRDGISTSDCTTWRPIACFQVGGDPSPEARFCAANLEDCELWRTTDKRKYGREGSPCAWQN